MRQIKLEVEMLLPVEVGMNSALLLARLTEMLEGLSEQARIKMLKYDPG